MEFEILIKHKLDDIFLKEINNFFIKYNIKISNYLDHRTLLEIRKDYGRPLDNYYLRIGHSLYNSQFCYDFLFINDVDKLPKCKYTANSVLILNKLLKKLIKYGV